MKETETSFIISAEDNFSGNYRFIEGLGRFMALVRFSNARDQISRELFHQYSINEILINDEESIDDYINEFIRVLYDFINTVTSKEKKAAIILTTTNDRDSLLKTFAKAFASEVKVNKEYIYSDDSDLRTLTVWL